MHAETVLVIILAVGMGILLILAAVVTILIISILRSLNRAAHKLEAATDNIPSFLKLFGKRLAPAALSTVAAVAIKGLKNRRRKKEDE